MMNVPKNGRMWCAQSVLYVPPMTTRFWHFSSAAEHALGKRVVSFFTAVKS